MPKAHVNNLDIYYEIHGSGDPLILIGGLGYDIWQWHKMVPELAKEFEPSSHSIRQWVRLADQGDGGREDELNGAEREELKRLRREVRQLRRCVRRKIRDVPRSIRRTWWSPVRRRRATLVRSARPCGLRGRRSDTPRAVPARTRASSRSRTAAGWRGSSRICSRDSARLRTGTLS